MATKTGRWSPQMGTAVRHSSSLLASAWPTPPSGESLPPPAPTVSTAAAMHGAPGPSSVAQSTTTGGNPTEGQNTAGVASPSSNPNSAGLSASMFSAVQNMTIHGGSYNLYVYPPHEGGSPNVAYAHPWVDSNDAVVTKPSLIVSDELLGVGSCGTVVYKGSFRGRAVAVKRLHRDYATLAEREISILQKSDDHQNVIRYYHHETTVDFLFIAIELCRASLADVISRPDHRDQWKDIVTSLDPKRALEEIALGLDHLHYLNVVHRDIKPPNILIAGPQRTRNGKDTYRMLISDFGICKKLDDEQTSFFPTTHQTLAGTRGWLAPELLSITSEKGSVDDYLVVEGVVGHGKLTKSLDIFPLGCVFYYTLTKGRHPYGRDFERDVNILMNRKKMSGLEELGEEGRKARDLITKMLNPGPSQRPDTSACLEHPYFISASAPPDGHDSTSTAPFVSSPLQGHAFQGRQRVRLLRPESPSVPREPDVAHNHGASEPTPVATLNSGFDEEPMMPGTAPFRALANGVNAALGGLSSRILDL